MRLGIVLCGAGVHAACCAGVMAALYDRHAEPYAVCGLGAGAWPAALFIAGLTPQEQWAALEQTARDGDRLLRGGLRHRRGFLSEGRRISALLGAQCGHRLLAACPRPGLLMCRTQLTGNPVIFSSAAYQQENGAMLTRHSSVSYAARAAMSVPPFLRPVEYMGQTLLPEGDVALACRQLRLLGAQRVMVVIPQNAGQHIPDALELAVSMGMGRPQCLPEYAQELPVRLPECIGALEMKKMLRCAELGRACAERALEHGPEQIGIAGSRVLPFRRAARQGC